MPLDLGQTHVGPRSNMAGGLDLIIGAAESAVGVMYRWGGNSLASGVDCSGLVQQAFRAAGYDLPRVSNQQAQAGVEVDYSSMQPGDLLYYDNSSRNTGADHIAIYIGNGQMIEARKTGTPIQVTAVRKPTGVRRIIGQASRKGTPNYVQLGPNQDRKFTTAAVEQAGTPIGTADGGAGAGGAALFGGMVGGGMNVGARLTPDGAGGFTVSAPSGRTLEHGASDDEIELYVMENYPQYSGLFREPELKGLIMRAATEDWDEVQFAAGLRATKWYQETAPVTRTWEALVGADPAAAIKQQQDREAQISQTWIQAGGGNDTTGIIAGLAEQSLRFGWSGQKLQQEIIETINRTTGNIGAGTITSTMDQVENIAAAYLMPLDDITKRDWAMRIEAGTQTMEGFQSYVVDVSKGRFSTDASVMAHIERGGTIAQYFAPHQQTVAQLLEISPDQIDLQDPKWSEVTERVDEKGNRRAPTLGEVASFARHRPEFNKTAGARNRNSEIGAAILRDFGQIA